MAWALVGTIGAANATAVNTANTPAWGASENRTQNNLLICFCEVTGVATLPTTPAGWSIAKQVAGTSCSATIYFKLAAGADAAPTIAAITSGVTATQLAEFSGVSALAVDQSGSATGTTSPTTATLGGADAASAELILMSSADFRSVARAPNNTWTSNHVTSVTQAGNNNGTSIVGHYSFGYGSTNSNSGADTAIMTSSVTTSITGRAVVAATFKLKTTPTGSFTGNANIKVTQDHVSTETILTPTTPTNSDLFGNIPGLVRSKDGSVWAAPLLGASVNKFLVSKSPFTSKTEISPTGITNAVNMSIAISADGSTIAVGCKNTLVGGNAAAGRVWVYTGTNWSTETILDGTGLLANYRMGWFVAISDDGTTVFATAPGDQGGGAGPFGAIYIFSGSSWSTQTVVRPAVDGASVDFGVNGLVCSSDGSVVVTSDPLFANGGSLRGRINIFSGASWGTETQKTPASPVDSDQFGQAIAISGDGTVIAAASPSCANGGTARGKVWLFSGSSWGTETGISVAAGAADNQTFGSVVKLNTDGTKLLSSAYTNPDGGTARGTVYVNSGSSWATQTKVSSSAPASNAEFGYALDWNPDDTSTILVGAATDVVGGTAKGKMYLCSGSNWTTQVAFSASDGLTGDHFGTGALLLRHVSDSDYVVAAGAPNVANGGSNRGKVYVYTRTPFAFTGDATISAGSGGGAVDEEFPYPGGGYYP